MIPSNIPQTPWRVSPEVSARLQPVNLRFKAAVLLPTDPESQFVLAQFMADKPPGFSITKITYVYNSSLQMGFLAHLSNIEHEAKKFVPTSLSAERKEVVENWKDLTSPYSPLQVTIDQEEQTLHHAKLLPLWHGTSLPKSQSICESGFTYFGKHTYFSGHGSGSTDIGYFGSGIYFTESAQYASMYSKGALLLSWVSMREPYPVISDKAYPQKCSDMQMLEGKGAFHNYDTHFVPVASILPDNPYCMDYYPCVHKQPPAWHEIVVFQKAQTLPSFIIEIGVDLLPSLSPNYTFEGLYASCQAGDLPQVKSWILEDKKRLLQEDAQGENCFFAAILGGQLPVLKWLLAQDPTVLKKERKDGWTPMHVAAMQGDAPVVSWLHRQDPGLILSSKPTPLHCAAFSEQIPVLKLFLEEVKKDTFLIEEILKRPCPLTLQFLLENGLDPDLANRFKQTLLHLAAQAGQVDHIELLIDTGAQINAQDLSKKTPLYLAVAQGHISAVKCLLANQADPSIVGIEGDTILHVAAFYGYTPIVALLLKYPLIHCADEDGKQPIHKAVWGHDKPDVVELLLNAGADPNASNAFEYTPLHWAAKHGHIASAEILLKAGARPDSANLNHDLPFDLAVRWGQDAFVRFFLGVKPKEPEQLPQDIEGYYCTQLLQAKRDENYQEQIFYLEKLSDLYIQKNQWVQAAKILNGAFAILEKNGDNPLLKQYLLARLERIEALFLESKGFKVPHHHKGSVLGYRLQLKNARVFNSEGKSIQQRLKFLTAFYKKLLGTIILDSRVLLGPAPVDWACVGMGSMARDEMCPYSDLEFAFLISKKIEKNLGYFRTLAELVELKVINLGETVFPLFGTLFDEKSPEASPTLGGFSMDSGGNTPLGKPGFYELIDTPEGLAQYQSVHWMEADIIATNALSTVCYVAGDKRLFMKYNQAKQAQHSRATDSSSFTGTPLREILALKLLAGHLQEFKPNLSKSKQETGAFGIKKELYRPFQSILGSLTLFYGLPTCSTFGMIQQLLQKGFLCSEGAKNLLQALSQLLSLRFEAHTFYNNEGEFLLHVEQGQPQDPKYLYLDETRLVSLHEIYKVLIPFHTCAEKFLHAKNPQLFSKSLFYDKSPQIQGKAFEQSLQYGKAQEAHQQAVSLNPNDLMTQLQLGDVEAKMAQYQEALKRNLKALALAQEKHGENHPAVATSYNNIGGVYANLGKWTQALEFFQKALKIELQVHGENHSSVAISYCNIGSVYDNLGELTQALEFYQKALKIQLQVHGENHPGVAISYNNIGGVYAKLGELTQALEFLQKALKIKLQIIGENHPDVGLSYNNIGNVYDNLGKRDKALEFYQKALKIQLQVHGENHPDVAISYNNIGGVYDNLGKWTQALEFYQKALKIQLQVHGENHPDVAISYNNIGGVYDNLGKWTQALEFYQKALKIQLQVYGENHSSVAISYSNLGMVYKNLGELTQALELYQKALKIQLQVHGENHPDVATNYNNIGGVYDNLGKKDKALEFFQKALKIRLQVHGENHSSVAISYNNIGGFYNNFEMKDQALEFFQKALKIQLQILDENHPDLATSYNNIGGVYRMFSEWTQALEFYQKTLKIQLQVHGENHPNVATSYNKIGSVYWKLGEKNKALEFFHMALKVQLQVLSENHPDVATSCNNIGGVYNNLGKWTQALEFYQKALKVQLQVHGENHPDVATNYNDIGDIYRTLGEQDKTHEFYYEALKIRAKVLDENHPDLATSFNNMGSVYKNLGEHAQSLQLYNEALKIRLQIHGENHPDVATSYSNMGSVCENLGGDDKALEFFQMALKIRLQVLDENHPEVGIIYNKIGSVYWKVGENDKALEFFQMALKIKLQTLGENHPEVATSYNNIASIYCILEKHNQALEFYQMALKLFLAFGKDHPHIETVLECLIACAAMVTPSQVKILQEVSILCTKVLGKQHPKVQQLIKIVGQ